MTPSDSSPDNHGHGRLPRVGARFEPVVVKDQSIVTYEASVEPEGFNALNLNDYFLIFQRYKKYIIGSVVVALLLGIAITLLSPRVYTAGATLQIDREAARVVNVEGMESMDRLVAGEEFFQTQYGLLKSRSLAARVVDKLDLANNEAFLAAAEGGDLFSWLSRSGSDDTVEERRIRAIRAVEDHLEVVPVRGSRLVGVYYDSTEPAYSAIIANAVAENFISSNLERRFEATSYARDFLEQRLAILKKRLEESERALVAYAASKQIINVPSSGATAQADPSGGGQSLTAANLVALNGALAAAKSERIRAEQRWRQAQSANGMALPDVLASPTIQELTQLRAKYLAEYQDKGRIYQADYPAMKQLQAQISELDRQIQLEVQNIKGSIRNQYEASRAQEAALSGQVSGLKSEFLDLRDRSIQYNILQREADTNRTQYEGLLQRYKEIAVVGAVGANNISVVDRAEPPKKASKPKPLINMAIALFAGLIAGCVLALVLDAVNDAINSPEDVESKLGMTLLGAVPQLDAGLTPLVELVDPRSSISEAYASIRTALQFSTSDGVPPSLLVTSSRPAEGKSTSAIALAHTFARIGMRVLLIDADLRNPSVHRLLATDNTEGLAQYLTGAKRLPEIVTASSIPDLAIVTSGAIPVNPAELLSGPRLRELLRDAGDMYDLVILDGPPVMGLADAPILASAAAGTILVMESRGIRRGVARTAINRLLNAKARMLGVLLTKFSAKSAAYNSDYAYSYEYSYGPKDDAKKARLGSFS